MRIGTWLLVLVLLAPGLGACREAQPSPSPSGPPLPGDAAARALLDREGWTAEGPPTPVELDFPQDLGGIPFLHYQEASRAIGLDLTPLAGRRGTVLKYPLTVRTGKGSRVYAYMAIHEDRVAGAWISSDAPVAPGILRLTDHETWKRW